MACDINTFVEIKKGDKWDRSFDDVFKLPYWPAKIQKRTHTSTPFDWKDYGMYGFFADVRNNSEVPPLSSPKGIPEGCTALSDDIDNVDYYSWTWLSLKELGEFDYDKTFEDRQDCEPGVKGVVVSFRSFLGQDFFSDIEALKLLGKPDQVRVIIWFGN